MSRIRFECPTCSAKHGRGYLDGVSLFRCLRCGYQGESGLCADSTPKSAWNRMGATDPGQSTT